MRDAAAGIVRLGLTFDLVLTSPLTRCAQTAEIVGGALGRVAVADDRLRPGLDVDALIDLLLEHPATGSMLVCGHQPDLTLVTSDLVSGGLVEFKKGSLAVIDLDEPRARAGVRAAVRRHRVAARRPAPARLGGRTRGDRGRLGTLSRTRSPWSPLRRGSSSATG